MEKTINKKTKIGIVKSDKMEKTVVVNVISEKVHPVFQKRIKTRKSFKAHDEENMCGIGDTVLIEETRPLSKDKTWRVVKILEKARLDV